MYRRVELLVRRWSFRCRWECGDRRSFIRHIRQRAFESERQDVIHGLHKMQLHRGPQVFRNLGEILFVIRGEQDFEDAGAMSGQQLFFQAADG